MSSTNGQLPCLLHDDHANPNPNPNPNLQVQYDLIVYSYVFYMTITELGTWLHIRWYYGTSLPYFSNVHVPNSNINIRTCF